MKSLKTVLYTSLAALSLIHLPLHAQDQPINNPVHNEQQIEKLNLNAATLEDLVLLPGIGKSKAQAIISYREEMGYFIEVDQITEVRGIGQKMLEKIRNHVKVE